MAVIKSKKAKKYSINAFIFLFFTKFLIADPNAAQGDIDIGHIINATIAANNNTNPLAASSLKNHLKGLDK